MRKFWFILLPMVVLAALFFVGCGDDDDETAAPTTSVAPATFTNGDIYIDGDDGLYFYIYTFVHGGASTSVDSIRVDTAFATIHPSYYWNYADPYWYCEYYESEDPSAYESGDNVTISMFGDGLSSSCTISLLNYDDDEAEIISPSSGTTVATNDTLEVIWATVDNAEYYAIYTQRRWDSSGTTVWEYDYTNTLDTTYTLPERFTDNTVDYFYFYVMPVCGPDPTSYTGNWTGNLTTGVLYSYADDDYVQVYVSTPPPKANPTTSADDDGTRKTAREIIRGVYGLDQ